MLANIALVNYTNALTLRSTKEIQRKTTRSIITGQKQKVQLAIHRNLLQAIMVEPRYFQSLRKLIFLNNF